MRFKRMNRRKAELARATEPQFPHVETSKLRALNIYGEASFLLSLESKTELTPSAYFIYSFSERKHGPGTVRRPADRGITGAAVRTGSAALAPFVLILQARCDSSSHPRVTRLCNINYPRCLYFL